MQAISTNIEPATVRILQTEGFRLKELMKAMFGKDVKVELNITKVPQDKIDFMNGNENSYTSHIVQDDLTVNLESEDVPLPF